jgi:hypothetical protein
MYMDVSRRYDSHSDSAVAATTKTSPRSAMSLSRHGMGQYRTMSGLVTPAQFLEAAETCEDVSTIRAYIAQGSDVDVVNEDGFTALIWAAMNNSVAVAQLLCDAGINVNAVDKDGWTALVWASVDDTGDAAVLRYLLSVPRVDLSVRTRDGMTALQLAASRGLDAATALLKEALLRSSGVRSVALSLAAMQGAAALTLRWRWSLVRVCAVLQNARLPLVAVLPPPAVSSVALSSSHSPSSTSRVLVRRGVPVLAAWSQSERSACGAVRRLPASQARESDQKGLSARVVAWLSMPKPDGLASPSGSWHGLASLAGTPRTVSYNGVRAARGLPCMRVHCAHAVCAIVVLRQESDSDDNVSVVRGGVAHRASAWCLSPTCGGVSVQEMSVLSGASRRTDNLAGADVLRPRFTAQGGAHAAEPARQRDHRAQKKALRIKARRCIAATRTAHCVAHHVPRLSFGGFVVC